MKKYKHRKKVWLRVTFAAIAAVAGWNYNQNMNNVNLSDLALENVEALASGESQVKLQFINGESQPCMNCPEINASYCNC